MRLADVTDLLDSWYDPRWAEPWDRVGLVCGDPAQDVRRVLFAVDPVDAVVDEALEQRADLLVVHHPLLLTPVSSVAATNAKGRVLHRLIREGVALFTAHTNADVPPDGVNDAMARALGLLDARVLHPLDGNGLDELAVFGSHAPTTGSGPAVERGHGRVGVLPEPTTLRGLADLVAGSFPRTAHGVRVAGDPDRVVRTVAVGAGSGESLLADARRSGADAYVTSDLKHHRAGEFLEDGGPALVDLAHWAAEWSWLPIVAFKLHEAAAAAGDTVDTRVSTRVTDPWTFRP